MRPVEVDDIVLGDLHSAEASDINKEDAFELVSQFKPKRVWLHDAISFLQESHHNDPITRVRVKMPSLQEELVQVSNEIKRFGAMCEVMVVSSNHHDHVAKWLNGGKINNIQNTELYHEIWLSVIRNPTKSAFECAIHAVSGIWVTVPGREGYRSHNIELALHGDKGASGSRGSLRGFASFSNKTISGHSHQPGIFKGSYKVGTTGPVAPGYAQSYNATMLCHALVYSNGTRTLVSRNNIC
jgi:hypothetical protein